MNELKTLKNLKYWIGKVNDVKEMKDRKILILHKLVEEQDLRNEAIKWIKELNCVEKKEFDWGNAENGELSDMKFFDKFKGTDYNDFDEVRNWIKYFFGIKDEDLK